MIRPSQQINFLFISVLSVLLFSCFLSNAVYATTIESTSNYSQLLDIEPDKKAKRLKRKYERSLKRARRKEARKSKTPKRYLSVYKLSTDTDVQKLSSKQKDKTVTYYVDPAREKFKDKLIKLNEYVKFIPFYDVFIDSELAEQKLEEVAILMKKNPSIKASLVGTATWSQKRKFQFSPDGELQPLIFGKSEDVYGQILFIKDNSQYDQQLKIAGVESRT